jgi:hypothetical protein
MNKDKPKKKILRLKRIGTSTTRLFPAIYPPNERERYINGLILEMLVDHNGVMEGAIKHHVLTQMRISGNGGILMNEDIFDFVDIQIQKLHNLKLIKEYRVSAPKAFKTDIQTEDNHSVDEQFGWQLKQKYKVGMFYLLKLAR